VIELNIAVLVVMAGTAVALLYQQKKAMRELLDQLRHHDATQ